MSTIGTNVTQSVAGLSQAERIEARDKKPAEKKTPARNREDDLYVAQTESEDGVRALSGNADEETHEDRKQHDGYTPGGDTEKRPHLDIEG